jgi:hypothetical protein
MASHFFQWTDEIVEHLAEHDVSPEEFISAFDDIVKHDVSRSTGFPAIYGYDNRGRLLFCIYEILSDTDILPKTAFEVRD